MPSEIRALYGYTFRQSNIVNICSDKKKQMASRDVNIPMLLPIADSTFTIEILVYKKGSWYSRRLSLLARMILQSSLAQVQISTNSLISLYFLYTTPRQISINTHNRSDFSVAGGVPTEQHRS